MSEQFRFDVFLSYSNMDKDVVQTIAELLKKNGLIVWFDEWELKPGDNIPAKIDEGLEQSRVLVLCMSVNAFSSDWSQLEAGTFRFRDPLNKERRFIPLRLDDVPIKGSLAQIINIDWHPEKREKEFVKLLEVCRKNESVDRFQSKCWEIVNQRRSERTVIGGLLDNIETLLSTQPFNQQQFSWSILSTISSISNHLRHYPLLEELKLKVNEYLSERSLTAERLSQYIVEFRRSFVEVLQNLAANGAKHIHAGDAILLYAHSQSVLASINNWLEQHQTDKLELYFAQCVGKPNSDDTVFSHALRSANEIKYGNARIFFVKDSAIGAMVKSRRIKKVFFGAHQWGWLSNRRAWFTNTQGTIAIATMAIQNGVPIIVLVEKRKSQIARRESDDHIGKNEPIETGYGLPIEYLRHGADEIDSEELPFILVTDQGHFPCADHGLRKRNHVIIHRNGLSVTKTTADPTTSMSEKIVLQILGRVGSNMTSIFQTPQLLKERHQWTSVSMSRIPGIRMHDFIATLNVSRDIHGEDFAKRVDEFKNKVCKWAIEQVRNWQSCKIQEPLRKGFGDKAGEYEFKSKLKEAVIYVLNKKGESDQIGPLLLDEIEDLASRLKARASLFLRDANPKNQILKIDGLLGSKLPERCNALGYYPQVDDQWFDPKIAKILLDRIPNRISWEAVLGNIWQVDFELSSRWTTKEDDFIHILTSEVFSFEYDHILKEITEQVNGVKPEHVHETILFRSFRAWARRLFYYNELPEIFATRYRHESISHHRRFAQKAAEGLKGVFGKELLYLIKFQDDE